MGLENLVIVQARMGSSRLPGKVQMDLYDGMTIIDIIMKKLSNLQTILAVPWDEADLFAKLCNGKYNLFLGNKLNVHKRFSDCIRAQSVLPQRFVRICADNPFVSGDEIESILNNHEYDKYTYINNWSSPMGFRYEIVNTKKFLEVPTRDFNDLEHVTPAIRRASIYTKIIPAQTHHRWPNGFKISLDTYEDYVNIRKVFSRYNKYDVTTNDVFECTERGVF